MHTEMEKHVTIKPFIKSSQANPSKPLHFEKDVNIGALGK